MKTCGDHRGFTSFPLSNEKHFYHIVSQKKNESHDLRFLNMVLEVVKPFAPWFKEFNLEYNHRYGTAEKNCKRKHCDVESVYKKLEKMVLDSVKGDIYGELHVYSDRPLEFRKL